MTQNIRILYFVFFVGMMAPLGIWSCGEPMPSVTASCKTNDDCSGARLCMGSICVGTGIASVSPGTDASTSLDGGVSDTTTTEPVVQCPAQCSKDSECFASGCGTRTQCNQGTCQYPQRCPASCGSNADCSGCTGKNVCVSGQCAASQPECSSDRDCSGQRMICQSSKCIEGCRRNNDCRSDGEECRNNKCVRTCEESDDCRGNQRCRNGVCQ